MKPIQKSFCASLLLCFSMLAHAQAGNLPCTECGKVTSVELQAREGKSSAVGTLAGGALGAVLGRQIGDGLGRDIAGIAGAVGGAYVGREIEKRARSYSIWRVGVQYGNGTQATFEFAQEPDFRVGDAVKNAGNSIERQ